MCGKFAVRPIVRVVFQPTVRAVRLSTNTAVNHPAPVRTRAELAVIRDYDTTITVVLRHFWSSFKSGWPRRPRELVHKVRTLGDKLVWYRSNKVEVRPLCACVHA